MPLLYRFFIQRQSSINTLMLLGFFVSVICMVKRIINGNGWLTQHHKYGKFSEVCLLCIGILGTHLEDNSKFVLSIKEGKANLEGWEMMWVGGA